MASSSESTSQSSNTKKRPLKIELVSPKTIALSSTTIPVLKTVNNEDQNRDRIKLQNSAVPTVHNLENDERKIERVPFSSVSALDIVNDDRRKKEAAEAMIKLQTPINIPKVNEPSTSKVSHDHMSLSKLLKINEEIVPPCKNITETTCLNFKDLEELFTDQVCVLWVRNYIPKKVYKKINKFLTGAISNESEEAETSNEQLTLNNMVTTHVEVFVSSVSYNASIDKATTSNSADVDASNVQCFGINSYGRPLDVNQEDKYKYQDKALTTIRQLRSAVTPYMSPIDKFRLELDEIWPGEILSVNQIEPDPAGDGQNLHFDKMCSRDLIKSQFVVNMYMATPESGELEIWNDVPISPDLEEPNLPKTWRSKLKDQKIKVKPEKGDLLIFNNRRPHTVKKSYNELPLNSVRVFIGLTQTKDVYLWV